MKTNLFHKIPLLIIVGLFCLKANATHLTSAFINYVYIDSNQYLLTVDIHRDCNGIPAPTSVTVCYSSASAGISDTIMLNLIFSTGNPILITNCFTPPPPCMNYGIEEWTYANAVVLPQAANDWVFGFWAGMYSGDPNSTNDVYVYATLNNVDYPENSTPNFYYPGFTYYCLNIYNNINFSCSDIDGDSLVYNLTGAMEGTDDCPASPVPVVYPVPYSASYPLSSSSPVNLNSSTGVFYFTPALIEIRPVCIKIDEYRNGILIASFTRNNVITIIPTTGIDEPSKKLNVSISPNPFSSSLQIKNENNEQMHLQLDDITGRKLFVYDFKGAANIEVSHFAPGIYFYHLTDTKSNFADGKLVKE